MVRIDKLLNWSRLTFHFHLILDLIKRHPLASNVPHIFQLGLHQLVRVRLFRAPAMFQ